MWPYVLFGLQLASGFMQQQQTQALLDIQSDYAFKAGTARSSQLNADLKRTLGTVDVMAYSKNALPALGSAKNTKDYLAQITNDKALADYYALSSGQQQRDVKSSYSNIDLGLNSLLGIAGLAGASGLFGNGFSLFQSSPTQAPQMALTNGLYA